MKPWRDVESNPDYQALPQSEKDAAKAQYFDEVVAPKVPENEVEAAKSEFFGSAQQNSPATDYSKDHTATSRKLDPGLGKTWFDQAMQGATFGLADEVSDRIAAGIGSIATGQKYDDMLQQARGNSQRDLQQEMEQHPVASIAANLGGGIVTGGATAGTKAGAAIGRGLRSGGTGARIAKGIAAGAASGGAYGAGTAQEGDRLEGAGHGALLGGLAGWAVPALGAAVGSATKGLKNTAKGMGARDAEELADAAKAIKQKSSAAYEEMRSAGAKLKNTSGQNLFSKIANTLTTSGKLNKDLHGNTLSVVKDLKQNLNKGDMDLEELDQFRQLLGDVVSKNTDVAGKMNPDAFKASSVIRTLDKHIEGLTGADMSASGPKAVEALKKGREQWQQYRKFETVSNIVKKSDGDANYLKRELKKLADNPKKTRGFNADELKALKDASRLSAGEGILKMLGKFGIDLGNSRIGNTGLPALSSGAAYMAGSGGTAAAIPIGGTIARQGQKYLARGKAETLLKAIEGAAPKSGGRQLPTTLGAAPGALGGIAESKPLRVDINAETMRKSKELRGEETQTDLGGGTSNDQLRDDPYVRKALERFGAVVPANAVPRGKPEIRTSEGERTGRRTKDAELLYRIAKVESGLNPNAKAKTSSASGLLQFTDGTWKEMVRKYGKAEGITLKDKNLPRAQAIMGFKRVDEIRSALETALKRDIKDGEIYVGHFAGPTGAKKLLRASPKVIAAKVLPAAALANPAIFKEGKRHRTVGEVIKLLSKKIED